MATRLGDASIRILLEPAQAQEELRKLDEKISEVDKARQDEIRKTNEELTRFNRDTKRKLEEGTGVIAVLKDLYSAAVGVAETAIPAISGFVAGVLKGTDLKPENVDQWLRERTKEIIKAEAIAASTVKTQVDVFEYQKALLMLGGKLGDIAALESVFFRVNQKQTELDKTFQVGITRRLAENLGKAAQDAMLK